MSRRIPWVCSTLKKRLLFILIFATLVYFGYKISRPVRYVFVNEHYSQPCNYGIPLGPSRFSGVIWNAKLEVLDPFDSSIQQFYWKPKPVKCHDFPSIVYIDEYNVLHINLGALDYFGIQSPSDVFCSTDSLYRHEDDLHFGYNLPKDLVLPVKLDSDFNRVTCKSRGGKILYQNMIAGITPKPQHKAESIAEESEEQLSVLMFGIDSVSRSGSVRYLPKTLEVLRKLGSYEFHGVMKNGDNTLPNIIAQLSGLKIGNDNVTIGFEKKTFDDFPMLWKNFSENQYVTLFGEDFPNISMFNHGYKGFKLPPTDHYMRPFWLVLSKRTYVQRQLFNTFEILERRGIKLTTSVLCNQNTMRHMELINYVKRFFLHYKTKRKFAFSFLTELSHNFLNFLHHGDEDFKDFFLWLDDKGFLNRTVVVFFSDHGARFDQIRNTFVGRMESRMPMMHILLPEHIKKKFPQVDRNLKKNTHRLVSHFDIHQTMVDVLNKNYENPSTQIYQGIKRGVSLFQEISDSRSCVDAHIPSEYCACYRSTPVNVTNSKIIDIIANGIVDHLNRVLESEENCKVLSLNRILSAQKMSQGLTYAFAQDRGYSIYRFLKPERSLDSYSVIIETVPGYGMFDAFCELEPNGRIRGIKNVDRTNAYGNQSYCASDKGLRQYCYC